MSDQFDARPLPTQKDVDKYPCLSGIQTYNPSVQPIMANALDHLEKTLHLNEIRTDLSSTNKSDNIICS